MPCDKSKLPFCAIYSGVLRRGYDQIVHEEALQNLPDRFIDQASPAEMHAEAGLRAGDIAATLRGLAAKPGQEPVPLTRPRLIWRLLFG